MARKYSRWARLGRCVRFCLLRHFEAAFAVRYSASFFPLPLGPSPSSPLQPPPAYSRGDILSRSAVLLRIRDTERTPSSICRYTFKIWSSVSLCSANYAMLSFRVPHSHCHTGVLPCALRRAICFASLVGRRWFEWCGGLSGQLLCCVVR